MILVFSTNELNYSHTTQINIFWLRSANKGTHYLFFDRLKVMFDSMSGTKPLFIYFISVQLASVKVIYGALPCIQIYKKL